MMVDWGCSLPTECLPSMLETLDLIPNTAINQSINKTMLYIYSQVKQIMEEAVTRKFVHEDSSHIIALCGE
jgi:hypothetical protein